MKREQSEKLWKDRFIEHGLSGKFEFIERDWTSDHGRKVKVKCKACDTVFLTYGVNEIFRGRQDHLLCIECGASSDGKDVFTRSETAKRAVELYLQGLEQIEIAEILGCTVNDVGNAVKKYDATIPERKFRAGIKANKHRINASRNKVNDCSVMRDIELLEEWRGRRYSYLVKSLTTGAIYRLSGNSIVRQKEPSDYRARLASVESDKGINIYKLIKKDGKRCYLCGKLTDFNDKEWGNYGPTYPTIDHIIPISKGGTNTWENVKVCCAKCNLSKGDRMGVKA